MRGKLRWLWKIKFYVKVLGYSAKLKLWFHTNKDVLAETIIFQKYLDSNINSPKLLFAKVLHLLFTKIQVLLEVKLWALL